MAWLSDDWPNGGMVERNRPATEAEVRYRMGRERATREEAGLARYREELLIEKLLLRAYSEQDSDTYALCQCALAGDTEAWRMALCAAQRDR